MIRRQFNRVLSLVLVFVMTVSLFSNLTMPIFAETGVKTEVMDPVVTTAFKNDEVTLYASIEDGAQTTTITGVVGKPIQLYNKVTNELTGEVFYQFNLTGLSSSEFGTVVEEYSFVEADDVVYLEENSRIEDPSKLMDREMTDGATGIQVNATVPRGATLDISKYSVPQAGVENGLIWGRTDSVFYNVKIMYEGEVYQPENGAVIIFPTTAIPFPAGKAYTTYFFDSQGKLNSLSVQEPYDVQSGISVVVNYVGIVGVSVDFTEDNENVTCEYLEETLTAKFVNSTVKLYADNTLLDYKEFVVSENDIVSISEKSTVVYNNGNTVELYLIDMYGYSGDNAEMEEAITPSGDGLPYFYVLCSDVEEYVEPTPEEPDETEVAFKTIIESGLLSDFVASYTDAQEKGLIENMTAEQLAEINAIKEVLEEMSANTADWSEVGVQATVESNGVKLYRNPVTRPKDYVLAHKLEPMSADLEEGVEAIEFSEANIIGKYTDKDNNVYFIVDTDNWDVFEGRVPYRYISQVDVAISSQWNSIDQTGKFLKDTVKLYTGPSDDYDFVEISDGRSCGELTISYEIVHTKYSGEQEKWYWIDTPNWKDNNGNDVGYSRYVKAEDIYLVTVMGDESGISVAGDIPEGAALVVTPVNEEATGIDTNKYPIGEKSLFYDISLLLGDDANTQPGEGGITITFPAQNVPFEIGTEYYIYHVHEGEVHVDGPYVYDGGDIAATFTNLSIIGVTSSTGEIPFESFNPNLQYVFKNTYVRLYLSHIAGNAYKEVNVTSEDIITISGKYILEDKELMLIEGYQYTGNNQELMEAINHPDYTVPVYLLVKSNDVKLYVPDYEPTDAEKLYDRLTSSYVKEEWNEIVNEYTEEKFQELLGKLTEEQLEEINEFFEKLPTRFEEAYGTLLGSTTSEEFREFYVSLSKDIKDKFTFAQEISLFQHRLNLLIAEYIDKPEDYEFPGAPVESFTNVAPFVEENSVEVVSYSDNQSNVFARMATPMLLANDVMLIDEDYNPITKYSGGNLILSKNAVRNSETGRTTITLEAYVKGQVTTVQEIVPVDITFVLDVSGSMKYCMNCGSEESDDIHKGGYKQYNSIPSSTETNVYYYSNFNRAYYKAFYCSSCNGWANSNDHSSMWHSKQGTVYYLESGECTFVRRMDALEDAVQGFIDSTKVQNDNIEAEADKHRIAIVKFAGTSTSTVGNNTYSDGWNSYNNSQIVQNPTIVNATNYESMKSTVENLEPAGATQIDFGMNHAKTIVTAAKTATPNRKQVVIVFTDGTPTDQSGFKVSVANNAVSYAKQIKDLGATVYTISVANGSNVNAGGAIPTFPTKNTNNNDISADYNNYFKSESVSGPSNSVTTISDEAMFGLMNRFMHLLSSNNPSAVSVYAGQERTQTTDAEKGIKYTATGQQNTTTGAWSSYYLVPTNADDLTAIFGQISSEATGESNVNMGVDTKVEDIVAPQFDIPTGASNIKVYEVPCLSYNDTTDAGTWDEEHKTELAEKYTSTDGTQKDVVTVNQDGTVDVSGFDFAANFVSHDPRNPDNPNDPNPTFRGKKLQIVFEVVEDPYFIGGNDAKTNSKAYVSVEDYVFASPTVDVPVKTINPVTQNQHIYRTNSANLKELITKFFVEGQEQVDINKFIDGVNNAYADIVYTIKDGDTVIGTLTIPRGKSYDEAVADVNNWTLQAGQTWAPVLENDKTYNIDCTVNGGAGNTSTGSATATVYVYNPTITVKDSVAYLGDTNYPEVNAQNNVTSVVWKNGSTLSTSVSMHGTEPDLEINTDAPTGVVNREGNVPVNVTATVRADSTGTTVPVTILHQNCDGKTCTLPADAELVIHVYSPTVELKDSNVYYGGSVPAADFTGNIVSGSLVWSNVTLGTAPAQPAIKVTATNLPDAINTTEDISVNVKITRADNSNEIETVINHKECVTNESVGTGNILLHVLVPSYTFADANVHLGAAVPTASSVLDETTTGGSWVPANNNNVQADNVANSAPTVTVAYEPAKSGIIKSTEDIGVNVTITAGSLDATTVSKIQKGEHATDSYEFVLHVQVPTYTFKDNNVYMGSTITEALLTGSKVAGPVWPEGEYLTSEPTNIQLTYTSNPEIGSIINTRNDIPVDVVAKVDSTILTGYVVNHQDCAGTTGVVGSTTETNSTLWPSGAEFVLHVFAPTVTVKDSNVYYGGTAPTSFDTNVVSVKWMHGTTEANISAMGAAPEVTVTGSYNQLSDVSNDVIATQNDILINLRAAANGADITENTVFVHSACENETALTSRQLKLHVFVPSYTFADAGVHLGAAVPADKQMLATTTSGTTWVSATTVVADNYANEVPALELAYAPAKTGNITTVDDIGVNVTITAGSMDATGVAEITKGTHAGSTDYEFMLHVYRPELIFTDSYEVFGNAPSKDIVDYYNVVNKKNSVSWKAITTGATIMMTEAPQLVLGYTPATSTWVNDNVVTAESDFYVNVNVSANDIDITNNTLFVHENITLPDTHTDCAYAFNPTNGEFIIHIDILETDLTITKTVSAADYDENATFVFDVSGTNKDGNAVNMTVVISGKSMQEDATGENYSASVVISALRPKTKATVTEDTSWSWRYKVVGDETKEIASLDPAKGVNKIGFVNQIKSNKWLSSEAYAENVFDAVSNSTTVTNN